MTESILPVAGGPVAGVGGAATVRYVGIGVVVLLALAILAILVRHGEADPGDGGDDEPVELFSPGPAYGVTGTTDVTEVLRVEGDGDEEGDGNGESEGGPRTDGPDRRSVGDGDRGSADAEGPNVTGDDGTEAATDHAGRAFTHDVRERRDGEWLVEVIDGDRSARFVVGKRGSVVTVDPVASPAGRHGSSWVVAAERYLRNQGFATEIERE